MKFYSAEGNFQPYTFLIELLEHYKRPMMVREIRNEIKRHVSEFYFTEAKYLYALDDLKNMGLIKMEGDTKSGVYVSLTYNYKMISEKGTD
jgi:hypothetical protein